MSVNLKKIVIFLLIGVTFLIEATGDRIPITKLLNRKLPGPMKKSKATVITEYIEQKIDHFDPQNFNTFQMRYLRNDEFFQPNAPILIFLGGEWAISDDYIVGGMMYDIGKELDAQLFYTEHRYYGESLPTPNASTINLRFLTIEQSLADLAHFIVELKKEPGKENSKIVVVGGSYSATMATYFRQKYPHLVAGAWASSAPLNVKKDLLEFKEVIGAGIRYIGGEKCYKRIEFGIRGAEQLLEMNDFPQLFKLFKVCDFDTDRRENIDTLFSIFGELMSITVQYHSPGDIETACAEILNDKSNNSTDLEEFARWFTSLLVPDDDIDGCVDIDYDNYLKLFKYENWVSSSLSYLRPWLYQLCTQFGWFQSTSSPYQPFGSKNPVTFYEQRCEDIFGKDLVNREKLDRNIAQMIEMYGALNPAVTNVYFTNGKIDPTRAVSIQEDLNPTAPADIISTSSHAQDLYSISENDTEEMLAVKMRAKTLIKQWLS